MLQGPNIQALMISASQGVIFNTIDLIIFSSHHTVTVQHQTFKGLLKPLSAYFGGKGAEVVPFYHPGWEHLSLYVQYLAA